MMSYIPLNSVTMMRHDIETLPTSIPFEGNLAADGGFLSQRTRYAGF